MYIFNGLDLGPDNFKLKFAGSCIVARFDKGGVLVEEPIYISDVAGIKVFCKTITGHMLTIKAPLEVVHTLPNKLGWVNIEDAAVFCQLSGHRQQKQGLCNSRLASATPFNDYQLLAFWEKYPTVKEAAILIAEGRDYVALSPSFALGSNGDFYYKQMKLGKLWDVNPKVDDELCECFNEETGYDYTLNLFS